MKNKTAYQKAGVDIVKADRFTSIISSLVKKTMNKNVYKSIGGYAGLYKIDDHRYIAATTDGVGTKLKIAFETGVHDSVGIDLVAMSVNDLICVGAQPLFFLDYLATGKLELATSTKILKGIVKGCVQGKVALIGGETAEMPDLYKKGEYDLAGFAVGILDKKQILDGTRVQAGDVLIGIESSGPHSNGFSLIRKLIKKNEKQLLKRVFQPTKIYVRAIEDLNKKLGKSVSGMAHITGSGFLNVPRISEKFDYYFKIPEKIK